MDRRPIAKGRVPTDRRLVAGPRSRDPAPAARHDSVAAARWDRSLRRRTAKDHSRTVLHLAKRKTAKVPGATARPSRKRKTAGAPGRAADRRMARKGHGAAAKGSAEVPKEASPGNAGRTAGARR